MAAYIYQDTSLRPDECRIGKWGSVPFSVIISINLNLHDKQKVFHFWRVPHWLQIVRHQLLQCLLTRQKEDATLSASRFAFSLSFAFLIFRLTGSGHSYTCTGWIVHKDLALLHSRTVQITEIELNYQILKLNVFRF